MAPWNSTACLLRSGVVAAYAGHAGAVVAGMGIVYQGPGIGFLLALAAWGYLVYLQVRVALDAELFASLGRGAAVEEMDQFLVTAGLVGSVKTRTDLDRCLGAVRLWRRLLVALVVELVAVGAGLALGYR